MYLLTSLIPVLCLLTVAVGVPAATVKEVLCGESVTDPCCSSPSMVTVSPRFRVPVLT